MTLETHRNPVEISSGSFPNPRCPIRAGEFDIYLWYSAMPPQLILAIAALILSWIIFTWLIKIVKTTFSTAIAAAAIVLVMQLFFGIGPDAILEAILNLPQTLMNLFGDGEPAQSSAFWRWVSMAIAVKLQWVAGF